MNAPATAAAHLAQARSSTEHGAPVPESPPQLLATVQQLWRDLQAAAPADRPFLIRRIRAIADRYTALVAAQEIRCSS